VLASTLTSLAGAGLFLAEPAAPKGFMDTLPDPMKLELGALVFVIALITVLFVFLKYAFFKPIIQVMDEREEAIQSGASSRAEAAALVERRQAEYATRLRDLRGQAFDHRKTLAAAAAKEKATLVEQAREEATASRAKAVAELQTAKASAKADLMAQVEALSDSMVQHLLRQA